MFTINIFKMRSAIIISLFIFCNGSKVTFGQDTIFYDNKERFHQSIKYGYMDSYWLMPEDLCQEIDSVFKSIDFSIPEIPCQNQFCFLVDLDSCGVILKSSPLNNKTDIHEMLEFEQEVNKLILNSDWHVNNVAKMIDTTFIFDQHMICIETSCDTDEIIIAPKGWSRDMIRILAYRNEEELIIFDYFRLF